MTVTISPRDLSKYETFAVSGPNGNHVTIAVRSEHIAKCRIDDGSRHAIHLMIWGDFGPWEHYWSHAGGADDTWWRWLHSTDIDYMLGKLALGSLYEFDGARSVSMAHKALEEMRPELMADIDGDAAAIAQLRRDIRDAHNELRYAQDYSEEGFINLVSGLTFQREVSLRLVTAPRATTTRHIPFFEDYCDMSYHRMRPRLIWFWDNIWRPFITQAKATEGFKVAGQGAEPREAAHV